MPGTLFVVATPLGNLDDLSPRALEILRSVDCIACEDTRRTARLLARHEVRTPTLSCHKFNERERTASILDRLRGGESFALVSDGGTPAISDPGATLVDAALEARIPVVPVPGPSAATTLLSVAGLPAERYRFEGYLPSRAGERRRRLRQLRDEPATLVLLEAPHRILATLGDIQAIFGPRRVVLGRELTKLHETLLRGSAGELAERLRGEHRGEFTLAVAGAPEDAGAAGPAGDEAAVAAWRAALEQSGGDRRAALRRAARATGMRRAELYRLLVELGAAGDED